MGANEEEARIPISRWPTVALGVGSAGALLAVVVLLAKGRGPSACEVAFERLLAVDAAGQWSEVRTAAASARDLCRGEHAAEIAAVEGRLKDHEGRAAAATAAASADAQRRYDAEQKMNAAYAVWIAYGKLPSEKRTKETWAEALEESRSHGAKLGPPFAAQFTEANDAIARKHAAPLIQPETRATDEGFTTLVPSPDRGKCLVWASQWRREASMTAMGFKLIRCEASKHKSNITGLDVEDPSQEWTIQPY